MSRPLVTIITATFNSGKTLENTINSVLEQSYDNIEYIIIDGGSTDNTLDIISKYKERISHVISEPDNGVYDAWNKGIKLSKGDWISFLGSDDVMYPNAVHQYVNFIEQNPEVEYVSSRVDYVNEDNSLNSIIGERWSWPKFSRIMKVAHVGSFHNKSLYIECGLYNTSYKIVADYEFLLRKGFFNHITVRMKSGGISYSYKAIYESLKARVKTGKRKKIYAFVDFCYQVIVFSLVNIIRYTRKQ